MAEQQSLEVAYPPSAKIALDHLGDIFINIELVKDFTTFSTHSFKIQQKRMIMTCRLVPPKPNGQTQVVILFLNML